ncbi:MULTISPECIES: hypothetical protein [Niastella]|uniref:50S ribosomal protein L29 n=1 Tax=Niastella soli TaxID=2821487 RepID=A0ABS3YZ86_9BACT|nr:hypothetical protein [Niastella soli]MBO9203053.1 hypothetical protein [Niastella soli]
MELRFAGLSAIELRNMILDERRKFILALQFNSPLSDLEEIREQIRLLDDALSIKEKEELKIQAAENSPQVKNTNIIDA